MRYQIKVGVIGWIDAGGPWPIPMGGGKLKTAQQINDSLEYTPGWIVKTYMGLMATANTAPPVALDFHGYQASKNYRAMIWANLAFNDGGLGHAGPVGASYVGSATQSRIVDGGTTPPVDTGKVGAMGMIPFWMTQQRADVNNRAYEPGESSPISDICVGTRHPNSMFRTMGLNEPVIANGLMRFRASKHTDDVGKRDADSEYHVPWVWAEFLLTSLGGGQVRLRGAGSIFPTIAWYLNDRQAAPPHRQATDPSFPVSEPNLRSAVMNELRINKEAMAIWPVLRAGAPIAMPLPDGNADRAYQNTPTMITRMPWTCPGIPFLDVKGTAQAFTGT